MCSCVFFVFFLGTGLVAGADSTSKQTCFLDGSAEMPTYFVAEGL